MDELSTKSPKKKELSLGQLKAVASEVTRILKADVDDARVWSEFAQLSQSERRRALDLIPAGLGDRAGEKLARLARITLNGGVANRHEATLKSVAHLCARSSSDSSRTQGYLRQLLADIIAPDSLKPDFALPALGDVDPLEIAKIPGVTEALGSLFTNPIPTLPLGEHVTQWARLLGAVLVAGHASQSLNPQMASAMLQVCQALPLSARPLELRLSEPRLELLAGGNGHRQISEEAHSANQGNELTGEAAGSMHPRPLEQLPSVAEVMELLQRTIAALEHDQDERRSVLSARISALEADVQRDKIAYRGLEERYNRLDADFQRIRDKARGLQSDLATLTAERNAAREKEDVLRRELDLVGGLGTISVDAAKAEVRRSFMRLALLPLQAVREFAENLRANTGSHNPELLTVPLRSVIQVLHQQGFATEAEIRKL